MPLLPDYRYLRLLESRVRWVAGRGVETFPSAGERLGEIAELVRPGLTPAALLEEVAAVRSRVRQAYAAVIQAGTIAALERI